MQYRQNYTEIVQVVLRVIPWLIIWKTDGYISNPENVNYF